MPPLLGVNTPVQGVGIGQMAPLGFQNSSSVPAVTNPVNPLSSVSGFNAGNATGNGVFTPTGFNLNNPINPSGFGNPPAGAGASQFGFGNINQLPNLEFDPFAAASTDASAQGFNFFGQEQNGAFVPGVVPQVAGLGLGLAQTFLGFEQLGLAEDQFALQTEAFRDQQRVAAQENERLQSARASASRA